MTRPTPAPFRALLIVLALAALPAATAGGGGERAVAMAAIPAGELTPLYPVAGETTLAVAPFLLDAEPVTNAAYLAFVRADPSWRRSAAPEVFADRGYLARWAGDLDLGEAAPDAPVTNVSWFAAAAYCESRDARLPTEAEWEYAAAAGNLRADGDAEPGFRARILREVTSRAGVPGGVGRDTPNVWGVHDLHDLVWEWVFEVGSSFNTADSRQDGDRQIALVCGGASVGASDRDDYAAFLRYAFRSGLTGSYTGGSLGFRCASSVGAP